jgi:hypothetical protein
MRRTIMRGQDCYIVRDANGQALTYVYFEEEPGCRSVAHPLTRDEAPLAREGLRSSPLRSPCRKSIRYVLLGVSAITPHTAQD